MGNNNQAHDPEAQVQLGNAKLAYEKAVDGYQFQVDRYNTWMNYYTIFVGALFVALYSIWPTTANSCKCCQCHESVTDGDSWFLPFVISALGFFASACWYGALLGYRKWNTHWMGTVKKMENNVFAASNGNTIGDLQLKVYGNMPDTKENSKYAPGYISTQKITGIFIICIMLAWISAFAFEVFKVANNSICSGILAFSISTALMIILLIWQHNCVCDAYSSKIIQ